MLKIIIMSNILLKNATDKEILEELNRRKILPLSQDDVIDSKRGSDHYKTEKSFIGGYHSLFVDVKFNEDGSLSELYYNVTP